jgi:hypothetical protein
MPLAARLAWAISRCKRLQSRASAHGSCYESRELLGPRRVRVYDQCDSCDPVLVRTDRRRCLSDLVSEHPIFVDFTLTFRAREPLQVERTTCTREGIQA